MGDALLLDELGIAEREADAELGRLVEQRLGLRARHVALEIGVDLRLVGHEPAREEGGERELGIDDEVATHPLRLAHQGEEPGDDVAARLALRNRTELGGADDDGSRHRLPPAPDLENAGEMQVHFYHSFYKILKNLHFIFSSHRSRNTRSHPN